jgi:signal transduction histidine kinase/MFS family permease
MDAVTNGVTIAATAAHLVVLGFIAARVDPARRRRPAFLWLAGMLILFALATAFDLLPADALLLGKFGRGFFAVLALMAALGAFGGLVVEDMASDAGKPRLLRLWAALIGGWAGLFALAALLSPSVALGAPGWLGQAAGALDLATLAGILGFVLVTPVVLGAGFAWFYRAILPEVANRALYWVLVASILLMAMILAVSGSRTLTMLGHLALLTASVGAGYAFLRHRVFDIRGSLVRVLITLLLVSFTGVLLFITLYAVTGLPVRENPENLIVLGLLALVLSLLFVPVRQISDALMERVLRSSAFDPAQITREYSQEVSQAVDLEGIVAAATGTLKRAMGIRRSGLMLISSTGDQKRPVILAAIPGGIFTPEMKDARLAMPLDSPLYDTLAARQSAVAQFDIDYSPRFARLSDGERRFLRGLQMSAYAPVIMDNVFIGLMMYGAKPNDAAYTRRDLELLTILAQQIGFALRNARLVDDLQHLNASMRSLNRGLEEANKELGRLDAVKTDFVTIASHELRTPLAQIRGYTDMIDAVNEQGMLDQDQATGLVNNLRKATERMEELIAAMLDVSQLDVDAMDLRFTQTTPETVLRLAIEPLTDAIKQRKLNLSARWRGLPPIQADLQRLVQAFRNIIVNAIKFTPDGGHIEIAATLQPAKDEGDVDHVLVTISDTGVGIDKSNLQLIFKKFYRTYDPQLHSTGTYKFLGAGPGLGLTIAKGVIESHGGKIWAESDGHSLEDLPGTTIYVRLPVSMTDESRRTVTIDDGTAPIPQIKSPS